MTRPVVLILVVGTMLGCSADNSSEKMADLEAKIAKLERTTAELAAIRLDHDALRRELAEIRSQQSHPGLTLMTQVDCDELRIGGGQVVLNREGLFIGDQQTGPSCSLRASQAVWKGDDGDNLTLEPRRVQINDDDNDPRIVLEHNQEEDDAALFLKKSDAPMVILSAARKAATVGVFNRDALEPSLLAVAEEGVDGKVAALRMVRDGTLVWNTTLGAAGQAAAAQP